VIVAKTGDYKRFLQVVGAGDGYWLPVQSGASITFCSVFSSNPATWSTAEFDDGRCDGDCVAETGYADGKGRIAVSKVGSAVKWIYTP
jgi:hypothetical protein